MMRWFKSLFAWKTITSHGQWVYLENQVTGQMKQVWRGGCFSPRTMNDGLPDLRDGDIVCGPRGTYVIGTESEIWHT